MEVIYDTPTITSYGPRPDGKNPCIIVRPGEDPVPTCVNPQCPKADNCRKHIMNRTDPRKPSIAIITWYECDHYDAIDPEKYKAASKREQSQMDLSSAERKQARLKIKEKKNGKHT